MATPHPVPTHVHDLRTSPAVVRPITRRVGRIRAGLLIGATAALTVAALPGTAVADPAPTADATAARVAETSQRLEGVSEQLNQARVDLGRQQAEAQEAHRAAAEAQQKLAALDGQIRQLARSAYTSAGLSRLDVLLSTDSTGDLVHQMGTLDAIAGHTNDLVAEVARAADRAKSAQEAADKAEATAQKAVNDIAAQQQELQSQFADFRAQFDRLSAAQQEQAARAHTGEPAAVASSIVSSGAGAPSAAAQEAVDTALAQVGDRYVYGANGPDEFDCSGLTQYAYAAANKSLPHSSKGQSTMGTPVAVGDLQPGDLLFYYQPTSHVAMYIGDGKMVHASTPSKPVSVVNFGSMSGFTHARRIAG